MYHICIIGAGQLGSRHLQALKTVKEDLKIYVIDPSDESLKIAKERYQEVLNGKCAHTVQYLKEVAKIEDHIDIAIVSTTSGHRFEAIESLLGHVKVRYAILEKLLFTNINDLAKADELLKKYKVKTWVNCPMRMMPSYEYIRQDVGVSSFVYNVNGGNFGLITNTIHYLDWMCHLTNSNEFSLNLQGLDEIIIQSKRKGYNELTGTIVAYFKNQCVGIFTSHANSCLPIKESISWLDNRILIDISKKQSFIEKEGVEKEDDYYVPYQSELTTLLIEDIIKTGECKLPSYVQSAKIHELLMTSVLEWLNQNRKSYSAFLFS